jgi:hypothetical protein
VKWASGVRRQEAIFSSFGERNQLKAYGNWEMDNIYYTASKLLKFRLVGLFE